MEQIMTVQTNDGFRRALARFREFERRRTCTLMLTRSCNLNCQYCYERHKTSDRSFDMTLDTAKRIVASELEFVEHSDSFDELEIDFIGGEPMLNFPVIKGIVEWLVSEPRHVPYICFASTNGTMVSPYRDWLFAHRHVLQLGGSYDGTLESQRVNRGVGGSREVELDTLKELYPNQGLHMVVSKRTLPFFAEGTMEIQSRGFLLDAALAQGEDWTADDAVLFSRQMETLSVWYLNERPDLEPLNFLLNSLHLVSASQSSYRQRKFCGTGTHMVTYDHDGKRYGCHLFTPIVLGDAARTVDEMDFSCADAGCDPYCRECVLKGVCPTCAGFNFRYRGDIAARDRRCCAMVLAEMKASCRFQLKTLAHMDKLDDREKQLAADALAAYPILQSLDLSDKSPYGAGLTGKEVKQDGYYER